jgi:hypothetical protein
MDYNYQPITQSSTKIFGYSLIFFIIGVLLTLLVCYLIYELYLKNNNIKTEIIKNDLPVIVPNKLPQRDINIDDNLDGGCIQRRIIYDSDFDRTIYPIDDNEIIYF